jgi:hypothetical protein
MNFDETDVSSHKWVSMATITLVLWVWGRMEASFSLNEM